MRIYLKSSVKASLLAEELNLALLGDDNEIKLIAPLSEICEGALCFANHYYKDKSNFKGAFVIADVERAQEGEAILQAKNPRLAFMKALNFLLEHIGIQENKQAPVIHPTVQIGQNVVIEENVVIGKDSIISHNVTIRAGTKIGQNCYIQPGAVLGEDGFGFERDENDTIIRMPHLGSLELGDNVQVGCNSTICRGTMGTTYLGNDVKIDNLVHIAHNAYIDDGAFIIACAEVSGGVKIGKNAWVAPNASIIQKVAIGRGALVGIGAVVLKDVAEGMVVAGNPGKSLAKKPIAP